MSARATRPRSRRGRHAPPGELDPVAESSEEGEVASGSSGPGPALPGSSGPQQLGPAAESGSQGPGSRASKEASEDVDGSLAPTPEGAQLLAGDTIQHPEMAAPQAGGTFSPACGAPDVFQTLQSALASLEAAAAAWRPQLLSGPGPGEVAGRAEGMPGPWQEVAYLAEKNAWLRLALDTREDTLAHMRAESDTLRQEVQELQDSLRRLESTPAPSRSHASGPGSNWSSSAAARESGGPRGPSPAHPLLRRLRSHPSAHTLGPRVLEGQEEQLRGSVEKLKGLNRLLLAALQGAKGRCEALSMRLGCREAEATALRLALQYSEDCEAAYGALLTLREASATAPSGDLQAAQEEARRLLARDGAASGGGAAQPSPAGSSVDTPTPQEVATQLLGYIWHLQEHRALLKFPPEPGPTLAPRPTTPHLDTLVQAVLEAQPGTALPRLEKTKIQQDLVATRETLADLVLQLQLARREKRALELREAALRAQAPALLLLLGQLRWERAQLGPEDSSSGDSSAGDSSEDEEAWPQGLASGMDGGPECRAWDQEKLAQDLALSLSRAQGLQEQLRSLRAQLEQVAQRGRAGRAQSAELSAELCRAHRALVLGFRGAHRKQEEQRWKVEKQMAQMEARQAEELARLEATARALGKPRTCPPLPLLGETLL
ncbi:Usher syndrome type-1C protein-binding protein 1 isoform X2 [Heterocephalus glaber]|uniref:Usher syndrome type-1C protein-binding protein 1 isoform X2 n=1 Tax=Heterocephalus glaber TaxID=10181 RepID=A0AAX6QPV3_HETGA|nr:Usher syndrome type-1C protein-binding protein 1 isoform X2 [Heterocephalus glaber]